MSNSKSVSKFQKETTNHNMKTVICKNQYCYFDFLVLFLPFCFKTGPSYIIDQAGLKFSIVPAIASSALELWMWTNEHTQLKIYLFSKICKIS